MTLYVCSHKEGHISKLIIPKMKKEPKKTVKQDLSPAPKLATRGTYAYTIALHLMSYFYRPLKKNPAPSDENRKNLRLNKRRNKNFLQFLKNTSPNPPPAFAPFTALSPRMYQKLSSHKRKTAPLPLDIWTSTPPPFSFHL